jgi:pilus assembly protein Flp/PilA
MNINLYSASKKRFLSKKLQKGATMIEYALLASLVAVVAIGALTAGGTSIEKRFNCVATKLGGTATAAGTGTCP